MEKGARDGTPIPLQPVAAYSGHDILAHPLLQAQTNLNLRISFFLGCKKLPH